MHEGTAVHDVVARTLEILAASLNFFNPVLQTVVSFSLAWLMNNVLSLLLLLLLLIQGTTVAECLQEWKFGYG
jgi:hypothetical protein